MCTLNPLSSSSFVALLAKAVCSDVDVLKLVCVVRTCIIYNYIAVNGSLHSLNIRSSVTTQTGSYVYIWRQVLYIYIYISRCLIIPCSFCLFVCCCCFVVVLRWVFLGVCVCVLLLLLLFLFVCFSSFFFKKRSKL